MSPSLTPEQESILSCYSEGLSIFAGAGCGKTSTLVEIIAHELTRNANARILAVSFTVKSAAELRERLVKRIPGFLDSPHSVTTLHSLAARMVREEGARLGVWGDESIVSEAESKRLWEHSLRDLWTQPMGVDVDRAVHRLLSSAGRNVVEGWLTRFRDVGHHGLVEILEKKRGESTDLFAGDLLRCARYVVDQYAAKKQKKSALDFNDLEVLALQLVRTPELINRWRGQVSLVVVDEFQDINAAQFELIQALVPQNLRGLVVVGDPKQSIYRFRAADVQLFYELAKKLPRRATLTRNFRSSPSLIEFTNQICAPLFAAASEPYDALVPGLSSDKSDAGVCCLRVSSPVELASYFHAEVQAGTPLSSWTILLRRVRGQEKLLQGLREAGIPLRFASGGFLYSHRIAQELLSWVRGWFDVTSHAQMFSALRVSWIHPLISDDWLDSAVRSGKGVRQAFLESDHPVALALQREGSSLSVTRLLKLLADQANWSEEDDLRWLRIHEIALDWEIELLGAVEIAKRWARALEDEIRESEYDPPVGRDAVCVMTVHASKGLEFDRVVLWESEAAPRAQPMPDLFFSRKLGLHLAQRDAAGARVKEDPMEAPFREEERQLREAEQIRLFYVAATRARKGLTICLSGEATWFEEKIFPSIQKLGITEPLAMSQLLSVSSWRAWLEWALRVGMMTEDTLSRGSFRVDVDRVSATSATQSARSLGCRKTSHRAPPVRQRLRHSVSEWLQLLQCESRYVYEWLTDEGAAAREIRQTLHSADALDGSGQRAASRGSEVHSQLSQLWNPGGGSIEGARGFALESMDPSILSLADELRQYWNEEFPGAEYRPELPLEVAVTHIQGRQLPEILVGVLDLVLFFPDGAGAHIVDFKWSEKPRSSDRLLQTYSSQLHLYREMLQRAFFPLRPNASISVEIIHIWPEGMRRIPLLKTNVAWTTESLAHRVDVLLNHPGLMKEIPGAYCSECAKQLDCESGSTQLANSQNKKESESF